MRLWFAILMILAFVLAAHAEPKGEIKIVYPENIQFLMEKFKDGFQKLNPGVSIVLQKGAGPAQVQKLYSGNETADLLILSDDRFARSSVQSIYQSTPTDVMFDE